jgi:hypothetical protein
VATGFVGSAAPGAPITWIGGDADWDAVVTHWIPNDEPDSNDEAIFNTANTVNLANASESIMALTMSGGIDLLLDGNNLTVNGGDVTLSGAGTLLDVPTNSTLNTDDVFVNADASLRLLGGTLTMAQTGGDAVLTIGVGGTLGGFGTINSSDVIAVADTTVLSLSGNLAVTTLDLFSLQAAALTINVPANGRVDLDQNNAVVDITRNDTLEINGAAHAPAVDAYSSTMNLAEGATIDMSDAWSMNAGSINVNTNGINAGTAGSAATIAGAEFTQTGGAINLADNLDSLRFSAPYTATGGTLVNHGLVVFNADGDFSTDADFQMIGTAASITVTDSGSLLVSQGNFDLGGAGNDTSNVTTIGQSALNVNMDFDSGAGDVLDQRIELNGGILFMHNLDDGFVGTDTVWHLSGGVVNANVGVSNLSGDDLLIQTETINVAVGSALHILTDSVEIANPTINISGAMGIATTSHWTSSAVSVTGTGTLIPGIVTIGSIGGSVDVVWGVSNVDWDDNGATTISPGSSLTINANTIEPDLDGYGSTITIGNTARLDVGLNLGARWTLAPAGIINYNGDAAIELYLEGSPILVNGTFNHTGDGRIEARLDIGSTGIVNILTANEALVMAGGNNTTSPNTIAGGTINGPGYLDLSAARALVGYGTINAHVNVFGPLKADNGILNINEPMSGNSTLGTADADGILNLTDAWNTNVTSTVELLGGELRGATITNDGASGINGRGLVSARVINNTRIDAEGGTLIVETSANNNDWDGAGAGQLNALSGDLEIRDNSNFDFTGTVNVSAGRTVYLNGFALQFQPGSTLSLTNGTYCSQCRVGDGGGQVNIAGTVLVNAGGPSTLEVFSHTYFDSSSSTTLNDDLQLDSLYTLIRAGADFTGSGSLINLQGNFLHLLDGVVSTDLTVTVENRGNMLLDGLGELGLVSATEYQQGPLGSIYIDLGGTGSGEFDRLTLTGTATLDGRLNLLLIDGYEPAFGETLSILVAAGGVGGVFSSVQRPVGMPDDLAFEVIYNPTDVKLLVVSALPGDYNRNGVVDAADYVEWRRHQGEVFPLYNENPTATTPGLVDQEDYDFWRANFGLSVSGSAAIANAAVPGPASLLLVILAASCEYLRRVRK